MQKNSFNAFALVIALGASYTACKNDNFAGSDTPAPAVEPTATPTPVPPDAPKTQMVNLTCATATTATQTVAGKAGDKVQIQGEFCPSISGQLSVLFVIDFSGSMLKNDAGANCGRQQSIKAIYDRLMAGLRPTDQVSAGVVGFSKSATTIVPMSPVNTLMTRLALTNVCQGNDGTNYADAFSQAQSILNQVQGPKVIYFITDGQPMVRGTAREPDTEQAGLDAANRLRQLPELTLNAIFLGNKEPSQGFDPQQYLTQITGGADRVKLVANASDLAGQILQFATPSLQLVESTATAVIGTQGAQGPAIKLVTFVKSALKADTWTYQTEAFLPDASLKGKPAIFTIQAKDAKGETHSSQVTIVININ